MICIIPARKNSKGLKNKNFLKIKNKHLIDYTVEIAKKSKNIKEIYISTDDERIIRYYKNDTKVIIPFKRPASLSGDKTKSVDVYMHLIKFLENKNKFVKEFCVMLPTCPIRKVKEIDKAINIFKKKKLNYLISVEKTIPIEWCHKVGKKGFFKKIKNILPSIQNRQNISQLYSPNGSIYIFNTSSFKKSKNFMNSQTYCFKMNKLYSMDIDDKIDLKIIKKLI